MFHQEYDIVHTKSMRPVKPTVSQYTHPRSGIDINRKDLPKKGEPMEYGICRK
jgi:hypothetical protein